MAAVAHAHGLRVGRQGQLVGGAGAAEDVAAVPAVVLGDRGGCGVCCLSHCLLPGCTPAEMPSLSMFIYYF